MKLPVPQQRVGVLVQPHLTQLFLVVGPGREPRQQRRRRPRRLRRRGAIAIARRLSLRLGSKEVGVVADGQLLERAQ
jgi:hypothetical protein